MNRRLPGLTSQRLETLFNAGVVAGLTDSQLLDRFASRRDEGTEAAFEALVERHRAMVLHVCRGVLGIPEDVEDAFQATFLVLARRAGSIRERESVGPWLHGVALRVSARAKTEAARRRAHERRAALGEPKCQIPEGDPGSAAVLHEELALLPEKYRAPVNLCYLEGLSHEQVAARLGWPVGTVKTRLGWARETLRPRLTRRGLAPGSGMVLAPLTPGSTQAGMLSIPARSAIRAIFRSATGKVATAGAVSTRVFTLAGTVGWALRAEKIRSAATVLIATLALVASSGTLVGRTRDDPDDPEIKLAALLRTFGQSPGAARVGVPAVPARHAAPDATTGTFGAAPGWDLLAAPTPWRFDGDSRGFGAGYGSNTWDLIVDGFAVAGGATILRLIHPAGPLAATVPEYRPVVFDVEGGRHLPALERCGVCTDEGGRAVAMSRFRIDPALLDLSTVSHIGYERISPAAPPEAVREAEAWARDAAWRRPEAAEDLAAAPGHAWLIAPSRMGRGDSGYAVSGARGGVICDAVVLRDGSLNVTLVHPGERHPDPIPEYRLVAFDETGNRRWIDDGSGSKGAYEVTRRGPKGETIFISERLCTHTIYVPSWRNLGPGDESHPVAADVSFLGVERASPEALRDGWREYHAELKELDRALLGANEVERGELRSLFWFRRKLAGREAEAWRARYERARDAAMAKSPRRETTPVAGRPGR